MPSILLRALAHVQETHGTHGAHPLLAATAPLFNHFAPRHLMYNKETFDPDMRRREEYFGLFSDPPDEIREMIMQPPSFRPVDVALLLLRAPTAVFVTRMTVMIQAATAQRYLEKLVPLIEQRCQFLESLVVASPVQSHMACGSDIWSQRLRLAMPLPRNLPRLRALFLIGGGVFPVGNSTITHVRDHFAATLQGLRVVQVFQPASALEENGDVVSKSGLASLVSTCSQLQALHIRTQSLAGLVDNNGSVQFPPELPDSENIFLHLNSNKMQYLHVGPLRYESSGRGHCLLAQAAHTFLQKCSSTGSNLQHLSLTGADTDVLFRPLLDKVVLPQVLKLVLDESLVASLDFLHIFPNLRALHFDLAQFRGSTNSAEQFYAGLAAAPFAAHLEQFAVKMCYGSTADDLDIDPVRFGRIFPRLRVLRAVPRQSSQTPALDVSRIDAATFPCLERLKLSLSSHGNIDVAKLNEWNTPPPLLRSLFLPGDGRSQVPEEAVAKLLGRCKQLEVLTVSVLPSAELLAKLKRLKEEEKEEDKAEGWEYMRHARQTEMKKSLVAAAEVELNERLYLCSSRLISVKAEITVVESE